MFKLLIVFALLISLGFLLPENLKIPVEGATHRDWNHETFWYEPWGSSGVHKGIDIFGSKGTKVNSSTYGVVIYKGNLAKGGKVVAVLGPKWRVHYYAHLQSQAVSIGAMVNQNTEIGLLGDTGNAVGKPAHVHYSIFSLVPLPWLYSSETQGWKKMFFLNPHQKLLSTDLR